LRYSDLPQKCWTLNILCALLKLIYRLIQMSSSDWNWRKSDSDGPRLQWSKFYHVDLQRRPNGLRVFVANQVSV
jgi:hypothetical protein